jgi:hypothetical protein
MQIFPATLALVLLLGSVSAAAPSKVIEPPEDGVYVYYTDRAGRLIIRNDGARVVLGPRVATKFGKATLRSVKNDNSQVRLDLKDVGPVASTDSTSFLVIVDGIVVAAWSRSDLHPDRTLDLSCSIYGEEAAEKVAARLKTPLKKRRHPGHQLEVRWRSEKESYTVGEPVTLKMELTNRGRQSFTFRVGGQQRGPRDNQFRFLAYRSYGGGKAVPDTGDPTNFGGISSFRTLKPGESFNATVALDKWFRFTQPDHYRVTGMYGLELHEFTPPDVFGEAIWDELATGDCIVKVVPKK